MTQEAPSVPKRNEFFEGFVPHTPETEEYVARALLKIEVYPRIEKGVRGEFQFRINQDTFLHGFDEGKLRAKSQELGVRYPEKGFAAGDLSGQHLIIVDHDLIVHNVNPEVIEKRLQELNTGNTASLRVYITPDGKILDE